MLVFIVILLFFAVFSRLFDCVNGAVVTLMTTIARKSKQKSFKIQTLSLGWKFALPITAMKYTVKLAAEGYARLWIGRAQR